MSYCVDCGVKLAAYHERCPLCRAEVLSSRARIEPDARDYPMYRQRPLTGRGNGMGHLMAGIILSALFCMYGVSMLLVSLAVGKGIRWFLIPVGSLALLWFTIAYPFYRAKNTFFGLYTYDSIAVALYLLSLNFTISGDFHWAKYVCVSILFIWMILSGIFLTEGIRRRLSLPLYYILASVLFGILVAYMVADQALISGLVIPLYGIVLSAALLTVFLVETRAFDTFRFLAVLFGNAAVVALVSDLIISHYLTHSYTLSWSLIVALALAPLSITAIIVRKRAELRSFLSKKFHT